MLNNLQNFALQMIQNSPQVANNPQLRNYISVIQSGDNAKGAEIARNICQSYGCSPEEGIQKARGFFHI